MINNIEYYGFTDYFKNQIESINGDNSLIPARVTQVHKEIYTIIYENVEKRARLKGSIFYNDKNVIYPAVGDFVLVKPNPYGEDIIYYVLDRKSKFSRFDSHYEKEQMVAANFDHVFIISSLNHDFNIKRIERYLAIAWESGASPAIILTKTDLVDDIQEYAFQLDDIAMGVPVFYLSSVTGEGIDELKNYLKPRETIVFLGSSGVGKSSLVNALSGEEIMKVNDIREEDSKGRHTTTHRELIMLRNGTMIIDTPGMRELSLWNTEDGLDTAFSEIEELGRLCRFKDCSHNKEPGCRIKSALATGELSHDRWDNYIKLQKEAKYAAKKEQLNIKKKERLLKKKS
ncbi:ribosome small subunit-dependent GTPase A [Tissierella pigra]|uniref:Small ribosomal subunit biogenesis GTPase RsgA n=1 Tax=Tissierella pigra TaxID=2607614 RepID=A0A6N7Y119_9FIRM|nr:ribosome small subunit-dependent GTPase A [Tissierella pigra]MBU5425039.1 ribosome small subunit-dependent GTPase A [Tissierella pigra]MSU02544.1 ribosome small subunit-dependent GTPase A [Tissierella pigra]